MLKAGEKVDKLPHRFYLGCDKRKGDVFLYHRRPEWDECEWVDKESNNDDVAAIRTPEDTSSDDWNIDLDDHLENYDLPNPGQLLVFTPHGSYYEFWLIEEVAI